MGTHHRNRCLSERPPGSLGRDADAAPRRDRTARQRLCGCAGRRDRAAERQPASPPSRGRSGPEARRARRTGQPADRGREVLAARAAQALASLASAEEELASLSGLRTGTIHLGASSVPGIYLLPEALDCFRAEYPGVTVEVKIGSTADVLERLARGDVQLALVGATTAERVDLRPFLDDELVGIARPGLLPLVAGVVAAEALGDHLLLCREPGSASQALVDDSLARAGVRPAGRWELGASEAIKRAARQGLGIALLSRFAVAEEIARRRARALRDRRDPPDQAVALHRDGRRTRPLARRAGLRLDARSVLREDGRRRLAVPRHRRGDLAPTILVASTGRRDTVATTTAAPTGSSTPSTSSIRRPADDEERAIRDTARAVRAPAGAARGRGVVRAGRVPARGPASSAKLGLLGMHLEGYGFAGPDAVAYGLVCRELEAGDSGLRTSSPCRARSRCTRSGAGARRSRRRSGCRAWQRARRSAASA